MISLSPIQYKQCRFVRLNRRPKLGYSETGNPRYQTHIKRAQRASNKQMSSWVGYLR